MIDLNFPSTNALGNKVLTLSALFASVCVIHRMSCMVFAVDILSYEEHLAPF